MKGEAFCPAHVTGFFKVEKGGPGLAAQGTIGAGFSIEDGVKSTVQEAQGGRAITTRGHPADDTRVSEHILERFDELTGGLPPLEVIHDIGIPVGYGLGASGAVALSLSMALDRALDTGLGPEGAGRIAHEAEVRCRTGLGDVLAAYHGGFELRTAPGAPGVGAVEKMETDATAVIVCLAPVSTRRFIDEKMDTVNGLGGRMAEKLAGSGDPEEFQDMSLEFARHAGVVTRRMDDVIGALVGAGYGCGVALFGETVFALVPRGKDHLVREALPDLPQAAVITSRIDGRGAR
ncbi:archaeal suger kinase [Cenarchaeum symbiosum A]|uniref:Pantoate kinase n=1 Tax=Cenarchaeum symbiosum (strain A) TaxID=414004 RepID=A0RXQ7_CENSY|nr:archaeal suger kinase [Cenarchaeum symbiosum A]